MANVAVLWPPAEAQSSLWGSTLGELHLLSLDMIVHECHDFFRTCAELDDAAERLSQVVPPRKILDGNDPVFVLSAIEGAVKVIKALGIVDGGFETDVRTVYDHVKSLFGGPWFGIFDIRADELARDYRRIREGLFAEIKRHKFVSLPAIGVKYFDQERLFGDDVYDKFPSARFEITEAGNAIAFEMYTAAVFHFMRSAEIGLRALAHDRRISKLPKKRNAPIEMGTWEDIIRELDDHPAKIANWPNTLGEVKIQAQEFYNGSLTEYRGFKDKWRNHVMHTHREYIEGDALSVMEHLKRLMQTLASRISETKRTPLIWTKAQLR